MIHASKGPSLTEQMIMNWGPINERTLKSHENCALSGDHRDHRYWVHMGSTEVTVLHTKRKLDNYKFFQMLWSPTARQHQICRVKQVDLNVI
jgi:hypothetical protein